MYQVTVKAAVEFDSIKLPGSEESRAIEECIETSCSPSSALPLAMRQLGIVQTVCSIDATRKAVHELLSSSLIYLEGNRFDTLL